MFFSTLADYRIEIDQDTAFVDKTRTERCRRDLTRAV